MGDDPVAGGGRCMDGSMTGYYFRQGVSDTFVIYMHGGGEVQVNDSVETRRGRQLQAGDVVELAGRRFTIEPTETGDCAATP